MHFLQRVLFDARRPLTAAAPSIQRAEAGSPAPPLEEQEDGAMTVYRFQKEGAPRSREVSGGGTQVGDIPRRAAAVPLTGVDNAPVPTAIPEPSADSLAADNLDISVKAKQKRPDLATGETRTANLRPATDVPEPALPEESSRSQIVSGDVTSVDPVHDHSDPSVSSRNVESFQNGANSESLRQAPGTDTPSEPYPLKPSAQPTSAAAETDLRGTEPPSPPAYARSSSRALGPESVPTRPAHTHTRAVEWTTEDSDVHRSGGATPAVSSHRDAQPGPPLTSEPRVRIGQVDVVVVQTPPPADPAPRKSTRQFLSRNYLRRL